MGEGNPAGSLSRFSQTARAWSASLFHTFGRADRASAAAAPSRALR